MQKLCFEIEMILTSLDITFYKILRAKTYEELYRFSMEWDKKFERLDRCLERLDVEGKQSTSKGSTVNYEAQ